MNRAILKGLIPLLLLAIVGVSATTSCSDFDKKPKACTKKGCKYSQADQRCSDTSTVPSPGSAPTTSCSDFDKKPKACTKKGCKYSQADQRCSDASTGPGPSQQTVQVKLLGKEKTCQKKANKWKVLIKKNATPEECAGAVAPDPDCEGTHFIIIGNKSSCRCLKKGHPCKKLFKKKKTNLYQIVEAVPTAAPTTASAIPTAIPTASPSVVPTAIPTASPSAVPTSIPTAIPSVLPTGVPSAVPTSTPSATTTTFANLPANNCVAWRQTGRCDGQGPREPQFDKNCDAVILDGWSGYCECGKGNAMVKGCSRGAFSTCREACSASATTAAPTSSAPTTAAPTTSPTAEPTTVPTVKPTPSPTHAQCTCNAGIGAQGAECPKHGELKCVECTSAWDYIDPKTFRCEVAPLDLSLYYLNHDGVGSGRCELGFDHQIFKREECEFAVRDLGYEVKTTEEVDARGKVCGCSYNPETGHVQFNKFVHPMYCYESEQHMREQSTNSQDDGLIAVCYEPEPSSGIPDREIKVNFQPSALEAPPGGYLKDSGEVFGKKENGYTYGWTCDETDSVHDRFGFGTRDSTGLSAKLDTCTSSTRPLTADAGSSVKRTYTCVRGQGPGGMSTAHGGLNNRDICANKCNTINGCVGFDWTTHDRSDSCRTFTTTTGARVDNAGIHDREWCTVVATHSYAGVYTARYKPSSKGVWEGRDRAEKLTIACDNLVDYVGRSNPLRFDVGDRCGTDAPYAMLLEDTYGDGKWECLWRQGNDLRGFHYAFGQLYGEVRYTLETADPCDPTSPPTNPPAQNPTISPTQTPDSWSMSLPNGMYSVEVGYSDFSSEVETSGCRVEDSAASLEPSRHVGLCKWRITVVDAPHAVGHSSGPWQFLVEDECTATFALGGLADSESGECYKPGSEAFVQSSTGKRIDLECNNPDQVMSVDLLGPLDTSPKVATLEVEVADGDLTFVTSPSCTGISFLHITRKDAFPFLEVKGQSECPWGYEHLTLSECKAFGASYQMDMERQRVDADSKCFLTESKFNYVPTAPEHAGAYWLYCKPEPLSLGLERLGVNACSDGDLTTTCDGEFLREISLEEPMMLMRVQIARFGDVDPRQSFDLAAYDGDAWTFCAKSQFLDVGQWTNVDCHTTLYAEKIRFTFSGNGDARLAEVLPEGLKIPTDPTELVDLEGSEVYEYEGFAACSESAVLAVEPCAGDCFEDGKSACIADGLRCWGWAVTPQGYELYGAGAANPWECSGPQGLKSTAGSTTYRRDLKQIHDIAVVHGTCWEYTVLTGDMQRDIEGRTCSELENGLADAIQFRLDGVLECAQEHGWDAVGTPKCAQRMQFRAEVGPGLYAIFKDMEDQTQSCRRGHLDTAAAPAPKRRRQNRSQCQEEAKIEQTQRCQMLQNAMAMNVDIANAQAEVDKLTKDNAARQRYNAIVEGSLNVAATTFNALGTISAAAGEYNAGTLASSAAVGSGLGSGLGSGMGRRRTSNSTDAESLTTRPAWKKMGSSSTAVSTERRRFVGFFAAAGIFAVLGGITQIAGGIHGTVSAQHDYETMLKIAEAQGKVDALRGQQEHLRQSERIAQTCNVPSNKVLQCELEEIGVKQDRMQEALDSGFGHVLAMMDRNHIHTMTAIHQQRVILEAHSDQLDTIEHVLSRIQAELSRLVYLNIGGWTRTLETIRTVRSWLEDSVGDDGITHLRARSNDINAWCRMFDQVGSGDTVQQLAKWAESDDFREMSSPKGLDDASDWTECEKSDYAVGYTESFNSMKVLFEFAAMRWLFFTNYDSAVFASIQLYRGEMAEAYNSNMNRIAAIDTDATVRCVDSEFQCPSGYRKLANTIVDKMPCEMNSCICEGSPGQALRSRLCLEDGVTEGCSGDPPVGYRTEIVGGVAGMRKVFRPIEHTCQHGLPATNLQEKDVRFHNQERCARQGCFADRAWFNHETYKCELHECQCRTHGDPARGADCPANRRGDVIKFGKAEPLWKDYCAGTCKMESPRAGASEGKATFQDKRGVEVGRTTYSGSTDEQKDASCLSKCHAHPECEFWVRATDSNTCWLKKGMEKNLPNGKRRGGVNTRTVVQLQTKWFKLSGPKPGCAWDYAESFRLEHCNWAEWEAHLPLPKSVTGKDYLRVFVVPDECDRSFSDCDSNDRVHIYVANRWAATSYNEVHKSILIPLSDADRRQGGLHLRLRSISSNAIGWQHMAVSITYHTGPDPVEFVAPDGAASRTCGVLPFDVTPEDDWDPATAIVTAIFPNLATVTVG